MMLDARRVRMLEQHADLVAISLDGTPESHAEMRGSPHAYDAMVRHLPNLRRSGIPFGFIFTLTFHNVDELEWVARFAINQGAGLLQIHPLEPVGRARHLLSESIPDLQENEYALLEASRLRDQYGDQIQIQLDLATWPAIHDHPEKVFADGAPRADASLADLVAPLVLQTDGVVAPLRYGFPRRWCLGNLKDARLQNLAPPCSENRKRSEQLNTAARAAVNMSGAMTDAAFLELLASYAAALAAARRSLTIARTLAEAHRSGLRPPEFILDAYLVTIDRDEAQLAVLREKVQQFES